MNLKQAQELIRKWKEADNGRKNNGSLFVRDNCQINYEIEGHRRKQMLQDAEDELKFLEELNIGFNKLADDKKENRIQELRKVVSCLIEEEKQ